MRAIEEGGDDEGSVGGVAVFGGVMVVDMVRWLWRLRWVVVVGRGGMA